MRTCCSPWTSLPKAFFLVSLMIGFSAQGVMTAAETLEHPPVQPCNFDFNRLMSTCHTQTDTTEPESVDQPYAALRDLSSVAPLCDFDRNGNVDILWRNNNTGDNVVWLMSGTNIIQGVSLAPVPPDSGWNVVGTGDFDRNGNVDILWRNSSTGENFVWLMSGTTIIQGVSLASVPPDSGWTIVGPR